MSVYLKATIRLHPGKLAQFKATLEQVIPIMESNGWKLLGSWHHATGPTNTVTDLWELEDANRYASARAALKGEVNPEIRKSLDECVRDEQLELMETFLRT